MDIVKNNIGFIILFILLSITSQAQQIDSTYNFPLKPGMPD